MPEPESKSVDLLSNIAAGALAGTYELYLAKIGETDPDLFNRALSLSEFATWLATQLRPLKVDGSVAGTGIQEFAGINFKDPTELTIASGAITVTQSFHTIDTEADAASDDLATITPSKGVGDFLIIVPANDARSIVIKHGTGNIATFNGADITLDTDDHWAMMVRIGTRWLVIANVATGAATDHGTLSGLGDDDHTQYSRTDGARAITGLQEMLGIHLTDATELTIASGAITATQSQHRVDTEADAASDDLDTITMASGAGSMLFIAPAHTDRSIVLKHGTGNIATWNGEDVTLDNTAHWAMLMRFGTTWLVIANSAGGGAPTETVNLKFADATELTIASGEVTQTQSLHLIDTEADAASDDLDTIVAVEGEGDWLILVPAHTDRTVVVKHGTGNIRTSNGEDITLDSTDKGLLLIRIGTSWIVWGNVSSAPEYSASVDELLAAADTAAMRSYLAPVLRGTTQVVTATSGTVAITSGVNLVYFENTLAGDITLTVPPSEDYGVGDAIEIVDFLGKVTSNHGIRIERATTDDTFFTRDTPSATAITERLTRIPGAGFSVRKIADGRWRPEAAGGSMVLGNFDTGSWNIISNAGQVSFGFFGRSIIVAGACQAGSLLSEDGVIARSNGPASFQGLAITNEPTAGGQLFLRRQASDQWIATASDGSVIDFRAREFFASIGLSGFDAAAASNADGGDIKLQGGAGDGTGVQGDAIVDGNSVILDPNVAIECTKPIEFAQYGYASPPDAATHIGRTIVITNAASDSATTGTHWNYECATSDGTYWRYHSDGAFVGGA